MLWIMALPQYFRVALILQLWWERKKHPRSNIKMERIFWSFVKIGLVLILVRQISIDDGCCQKKSWKHSSLLKMFFFFNNFKHQRNGLMPTSSTKFKTKFLNLTDFYQLLARQFDQHVQLFAKRTKKHFWN